MDLWISHVLLVVKVDDLEFLTEPEIPAALSQLRYLLQQSYFYSCTYHSLQIWSLLHSTIPNQLEVPGYLLLLFYVELRFVEVY